MQLKYLLYVNTRNLGFQGFLMIWVTMNWRPWNISSFFSIFAISIWWLFWFLNRLDTSLVMWIWLFYNCIYILIWTVFDLLKKDKNSRKIDYPHCSKRISSIKNCWLYLAWGVQNDLYLIIMYYLLEKEFTILLPYNFYYFFYFRFSNQEFQ